MTPSRSAAGGKLSCPELVLWGRRLLGAPGASSALPRAMAFHRNQALWHAGPLPPGSSRAKLFPLHSPVLPSGSRTEQPGSRHRARGCRLQVAETAAGGREDWEALRGAEGWCWHRRVRRRRNRATPHQRMHGVAERPGARRRSALGCRGRVRPTFGTKRGRRRPASAVLSVSPVRRPLMGAVGSASCTLHRNPPLAGRSC